MSDADRGGGITRRTLLKTSAAGAVAVGLAGCTAGAGTSSDGVEAIASTAYGNCWMCHKLCGMEVSLNGDGRAQELHGIDGHPRGSAGPGTKGTLCPKGLTQLEKAYSPQRIRKPHVRKDGELQPVSWDEAFAYAADRFEQFEADHGMEAFVNWEGWGTAGGLVETFLKDFVGVPNHMPHPTPTCFGSMAVPSTLMGLGGGNIRWVDYPDTEYVLVWGRDPLETFSGQWEAKQLLDARDRGATIVTIDPVFSETAKKSDKWLPIEPRKDGALALAMANVIIEEGLYDEAFVENYTHGFEAYKNAVADTTPEWFAEEVQDGDSISAADVREVAIGFAEAAPAAGINSWTGLGQSPDFFKGAQNVLALLGLVGAIDRPGGQRWLGGVSLGNPFEERGIELPHNAKGKTPVIAGKGSEYTSMIGKPVQNKVPKMIRDGVVKGMFFYYRNPVPSGAADEWLDALDDLDLLVTIDAFWSEASRSADVVFPEATQLEKPMVGTGGHGAYQNQTWITGSKAAIEPQWDTRSGVDIVVGLATAMGYGDSFPWKNKEEYVNDQLATHDLTLDDLEAADTYVVTGEYGYEKWKNGFANGSDRFWFDLDKKAKLFEGLSKLVGTEIRTEPQWIPPGTIGTPVTDDYPLEMIDSRSVFFSHGGDQALSAPLEQLAEAMDLEEKEYRGNYVQLNPVDATSRGIESGDMVTIESPDGATELMAKVTEGIVPGTVNVLPYGFGAGSIQPDEEGGNNMKLNNEDQYDPVSGQIDRHLGIEVRKTGGESR
jgi:thiosulfate reductase/polysulfide reductase chain A